MDLSQLVSGALETVALATGIEATYSRGAETVSLTVIPARTEYRQDQRQAVAIQSDRQDFLVSAASLVLDGAAIRPKRGDLLTLTRSGQSCIYEILPENGDQPYRLDQTETLIRLHTRARSRT